MQERLLLLLALVSCSQALYFHVGEGEERCFSVESIKGKIIITHYKVERFDDADQVYVDDGTVAVLVRALAQDGSLVLAKEYKSTGRISFVAPSDGDHVLCMSGIPGQWFHRGKLRIHVIFKHDDTDRNEIAAADTDSKYTEVQTRVGNLQKIAKELQEQLDYQKRREEAFRHTSESVSRHVMMWPIIQLILLFIIGYIQMKHLTAFFVKKKIV